MVRKLYNNNTIIVVLKTLINDLKFSTRLDSTPSMFKSKHLNNFEL